MSQALQQTVARTTLTPNPSPRRRGGLAFKLLVFLLLGAIINVAVAWGIKWILPSPPNRGPRALPTTKWFAEVPPSWPQFAVTDIRSAFGRAYVESSAGDFVGRSQRQFTQTLFGFGFPLPSLQSEMRRTESGITWLGEIGLQPIRPLWPAFAINTIFYAAIVWALFAIPATIKRRRRIKRGLCVKCAYPVGSSCVCSECGTTLPLPRGEGRGEGVR